MTTVAVNTYTHSVTYVADNILKSIKDIIRLSGLDPSKLVERWDSNMRALKVWLDGQYLERVVLEIFNPKTDALVLRWDMDIVYNWSSGDGGFWTDTDQLRYNIRKAGLAPSEASYRLLLHHKPNAPTSLVGATHPTVPLSAWSGRVSARQSNTTAWVPTRPTGGNPSAHRRRGLSQVQESLGTQRP